MIASVLHIMEELDGWAWGPWMNTDEYDGFMGRLILHICIVIIITYIFLLHIFSLYPITHRNKTGVSRCHYPLTVFHYFVHLWTNHWEQRLKWHLNSNMTIRLYYQPIEDKKWPACCGYARLPQHFTHYYCEVNAEMPAAAAALEAAMTSHC